MSWKKETTEIKKRRKLAKAQGGKDAIKLQHAKGRLTLRERIELLLDPNSFQEQGEIAGGSELNDEGKLESLTPANFILGFGKINDKQVVVGGEDFTVKGGSPNSAGLRKSVYTEELALKYKIPLIRLHEGGGGSVAGPGKKSGGYGGDPVFSKSRFKSIADTLKEIPVASAALGPVAGMPAARFVGSHFRVMTKETAQILVAGPAVVERAFGKKMSKEELGGSEIHKVNGVTDNVASTEEDAFLQIKKFLSYFPQNKYEITEKIDQDIAQINNLQGHYVFLIKAKRLDYSFEPGIIFNDNISENGIFDADITINSGDSVLATEALLTLQAGISGDVAGQFTNDQVYEDAFAGRLPGGANTESLPKREDYDEYIVDDVSKEDIFDMSNNDTDVYGDYY